MLVCLSASFSLSLNALKHILKQNTLGTSNLGMEDISTNIEAIELVVYQLTFLNDLTKMLDEIYTNTGIN